MSLNVTQSNQNLTLHVSQSNVKATLSVTQSINELHITAIQNNEITKLQPIVNTSSSDFIETDPVFQASEASNFVAGDKSNLDNQSGINTGDETTSSIQTKRPLKTINNESLEGSGNVQINYNDLDNLPTIPTVITNHSGLNLNDGTNPHGTTKSDVGLSNVDNTSDVDKPISTATQIALDSKLDKDTTAGVERVYTINPDGSQGTKATSEFKDVLEFANLAAFPATGETGKIYLTLDTNMTYRWSGSAYVQIGVGGTSESDLYRSFFQYSARNDAAGIVGLNAPIALVASGTQSVVGITGVSKYASIPLQNYLSATPNGSNCGWKQISLADGVIRQGFDIYMIWANNDANVNCETTVGGYSLLTAIPNVAKSAYTTNFFGVGNDVGDANLSFYCKRMNVPESYIKVPTNSSFPHNTTSAYILRMEAPCTEVDADKYIKMTLTNIITGATISHTFTYTEVPILSANVLCVINRNNRNTGVATNIRPSKIHYSRLIY